MSNPEAIAVLRRLGWRIRTTGEYRQAVQHFQAAVVIGGKLKVDGIVGPKTMTRLRLCDERRAHGLPTASAHFSFTEFRCKCGGKFTACARIWVKRSLIVELEAYRAALRRGISIVSGCRCVGHNKAVKGAAHSRHMLGDAADFTPAETVDWFDRRDLFHGRGYNPWKLVRHGDMRPGQVTWRYAT